MAKNIDIGLGDATPPMDSEDFMSTSMAPLSSIKPSIVVDKELVAGYLAKVRQEIAKRSTKRDILEMHMDDLSECVGLATEIYKQFPIPDNAYQLSALANTHKALLVQLEKMIDPYIILDKVEEAMRDMFILLVKILIDRVHEVKLEFSKRYPNDKDTIEGLFSQMADDITPAAQQMFDNLRPTLINVLGIKLKKGG